jgi:hypothetical protein
MNESKKTDKGDKNYPSFKEIEKMLQVNGFKKENADIWDIGEWELKISIDSFDIIDIDKLIGLRKRTIKRKMAIVRHGILNDIKNKLNIELKKIMKEVYGNYE